MITLKLIALVVGAGIAVGYVRDQFWPRRRSRDRRLPGVVTPQRRKAPPRLQQEKPAGLAGRLSHNQCRGTRYKSATDLR